MTNREKAICEAYTGICFLTGEDRDEYYKYLEELFGRPVYTYEILALINDIKEYSRADFVKVCQGKYTEKKTEHTEEKAEVTKIYFECNRKKCKLCDPQCRQTTDVRFAKNFDKVLLREGNVFVELTKDEAESFREQRTYRNMYRLMEVLDYADIARIIMTSKETEKAIRTVALEDEIRIIAGNNFVIDLRPLAQRLADIDTEMTDYNTWLDHVWRRLREGVSPEDVVKDLQYLLDKSIEKITEE